ncbi:hypothetical protein P3T76_011558 [Phytophthora citrophthora]|uniref:Uncharacterized protein n=1 Tax=Phytophthora citrophthora TaxID=4793 RepID=A0AAD9G8K4_9STRA|nr:hypothetical protein P3T76_011558 [Phytophthora citrophthora]
MNSPTPTSPSALVDAQASPAASAAGTTTSAVLTSTAVSSGSTEMLSVTKYHALHKEKHAKKKSSSLAGIKHPAVSLKERFGKDFEEAIVDYDDVEEGELEGKTPAPVFSSEDTPDPPLGSRRPRDEIPDASSSKRPRSDEEASPMLRALTAPRTDPPVRAPWMPTEAQIHDRFGASSPPNTILLYSCNSINDDNVAKKVNFESETQRSDYYIGLFHELRYYAAKKTSRKAKCQSGRHFVSRGTPLLTISTKTRRHIASALSQLAVASTLTPAVVSVNASMINPWKRGSHVPFPSAHSARAARPGQHVSLKVILRGTRSPVYPITSRSSVLVSSHAKLRVLWLTAALLVQDLILQVMVGFVRPHHFRNVLHQDVPRLPRISLGRKSSPTNTKTNPLRVRSLMSHDPLHNPADRSTRVTQRRRRERKHSLRMVNAMTMTIVPCTIELLRWSSHRALR